MKMVFSSSNLTRLVGIGRWLKLGSPVSVLVDTNGAIERIPTDVDIMKKNVDEKV